MTHWGAEYASDGEVCSCEQMPVNYWRLPGGEWLAGEQLSESSLATRDAELYDRLGCVAWVIACPECGRVYAQGVTPCHG